MAEAVVGPEEVADSGPGTGASPLGSNADSLEGGCGVIRGERWSEASSRQNCSPAAGRLAPRAEDRAHRPTCLPAAIRARRVLGYTSAPSARKKREDKSAMSDSRSAGSVREEEQIWREMAFGPFRTRAATRHAAGISPHGTTSEREMMKIRRKEAREDQERRLPQGVAAVDLAPAVPGRRSSAERAPPPLDESNDWGGRAKQTRNQ